MNQWVATMAAEDSAKAGNKDVTGLSEAPRSAQGFIAGNAQ